MAEWIRVAAVAECPPGGVIERLAGDRVVAVANVEGIWHALDGVCPHQGGPLGKGTVCGSTLRCPWHGWEFDVTNGQHRSSATVKQESYEVSERDGQIFVRRRAVNEPSAEQT